MRHDKERPRESAGGGGGDEEIIYSQHVAGWSWSFAQSISQCPPPDRLLLPPGWALPSLRNATSHVQMFEAGAPNILQDGGGGQVAAGTRGRRA